MKNIGIQLFNVIVLYFISFAAVGQDTKNYKADKIADNVWVILETQGNSNVNIYLVEGKEKALVIDAGFGSGDLKAFIRTLSSLPLIMVNTHGHDDHNGCDHQFSKVYAHPDDFYLINQCLEKVNEKPELISIQDGYVFDLGGRKLEVIEVPGHTRGSIVLLDSENKILFSGDNTNALVWLFLKDCYPLEVYLNSLEKVEKRINKFSVIMPGHNTPLNATFISEQIGCVKSILDGTCTPVPYNFSSFTKGAMLCKYKTAEVTYNPDNLFVK